jgi:hypothetical protein
MDEGSSKAYRYGLLVNASSAEAGKGKASKASRQCLVACILSRCTLRIFTINSGHTITQY